MKKLVLFLALCAPTVSLTALAAGSQTAWGVETHINLTGCDPYIIRSADAIKKYAAELCSLLRIKRYSDTITAHYGDNVLTSGYSMMQLIEKGFISGQFANKTNNAFINILSSTPYDAKKAAEFTKRYFKAQHSSMDVVNRN